MCVGQDVKKIKEGTGKRQNRKTKSKDQKSPKEPKSKFPSRKQATQYPSFVPSFVPRERECVCERDRFLEMEEDEFPHRTDKIDHVPRGFHNLSFEYHLPSTHPLYPRVTQ